MLIEISVVRANPSKETCARHWKMFARTVDASVFLDHTGANAIRVTARIKQDFAKVSFRIFLITLGTP